MLSSKKSRGWEGTPGWLSQEHAREREILRHTELRKRHKKLKTTNLLKTLPWSERLASSMLALRTPQCFAVYSLLYFALSFWNCYSLCYERCLKKIKLVSFQQDQIHHLGLQGTKGLSEQPTPGRALVRRTWVCEKRRASNKNGDLTKLFVPCAMYKLLITFISFLWSTLFVWYFGLRFMIAAIVSGFEYGFH